MKTKFISSLRELEEKLRLLDVIKAKSTMSFSEMAESLQFRSQEMAFASSSTGNKPSMVKEKVGYNFRKTFRKPSEKFSGIKGKSQLCNKCRSEPQSSGPCPALNKKCNTFENMGNFAKMCKTKT